MKIATTILFLASTALAICGDKCPYYVPSTNETCMITFDSPTMAHRDCLSGYWFDAPIVSTPTTGPSSYLPCLNLLLSPFTFPDTTLTPAHRGRRLCQPREARVGRSSPAQRPAPEPREVPEVLRLAAPRLHGSRWRVRLPLLLLSSSLSIKDALVECRLADGPPWADKLVATVERNTVLVRRVCSTTEIVVSPVTCGVWRQCDDEALEQRRPLGSAFTIFQCRWITEALGKGRCMAVCMVWHGCTPPISGLYSGLQSDQVSPGGGEAQY